MEITGGPLFIFLIWNLFLAFIPLGMAFLIRRRYDKGKRNKFLYIPFLMVWLLFLPNSPYILTDLFHFKQRSMPLWFDLILILTFAWNGLMAGLISVNIVQDIVTKLTTKWFSWFVVLSSIFASGFGIYLGRYLRWNSWDLLHQPSSLIHDVIDPLMNPFENIGSIGMTICFSTFLILVYVMTRVSETRVFVGSNQQSEEIKNLPKG